ncbi:MAG: molybdopterin-dependent oxidoreductase [Acidobacteria bacterium]|nr:molybdopterin-dependent oxidoreductase [Acidobacteriota bacterium]
MLNRRNLLAFAAASASGQKPKLLLPSDVPDEFHLKLMWYSPVAPINPLTWRLQLKGLVEKNQHIPLSQLRALPQQTQSSRMKCVQCWSARASWSGFRFQQLLDLAKPSKKAKAVRIDCGDKWYEYFNIEDLQQSNVMFVLNLAGQPLPERHGAPLRLLDPSRYGYKSAKLITAITFVEVGKGSMACDIGPYYSPDGRILPGYDTPLDMGGKTKRKIAGGEITEY